MKQVIRDALAEARRKRDQGRARRRSSGRRRRGAAEEGLRPARLARAARHPRRGRVGVGAIAWGWSRRRADEPAAAPLDPALERRLDAELERFDG
jgi:hypothetical protein